MVDACSSLRFRWLCRGLHFSLSLREFLISLDLIEMCRIRLTPEDVLAHASIDRRVGDFGVTAMTDAIGEGS